MTDQVTDIMFPPGRLVSGIVGEKQLITDMATRQPKLDNNGQQQFEFYIGVAIPKQGEAAWWDTEWGKIIVARAWQDWPQGQAGQAGFAWKVVDGDSATPNRAGKIPNQLPGHAGHWVVSMKTRFEPQFVDATGQQAVPGDSFYRGCWVQVHCTVKGNATPGNPGVFLNHDIVAFAAHGERINTGPDASQLGFGQHALPPGASAQPLGQPVTQHTAPAQQGYQQPPNQMPAQQQPVGGAPGPAPAAGYAPQPGGPAPGGSPAPQGAPAQQPAAAQYAQPGTQAPAGATPNAGYPTEPYYGAQQPAGGPPPQQ